MNPLVTISLEDYKEFEKKQTLYREYLAKYNDVCEHNTKLIEKVSELEKKPTYEQTILRYKYYLKWRLIKHSSELNLFDKKSKLKKDLSEEDAINSIINFIWECQMPEDK